MYVFRPCDTSSHLCRSHLRGTKIPFQAVNDKHWNKEAAPALERKSVLFPQPVFAATVVVKMMLSCKVRPAMWEWDDNTRSTTQMSPSSPVKSTLSQRGRGVFKLVPAEFTTTWHLERLLASICGNSLLVHYHGPRTTSYTLGKKKWQPTSAQTRL